MAKFSDNLIFFRYNYISETKREIYYQEGALPQKMSPASYTVAGGEVLKNPLDAINLKRHFWSMNFGLIFKFCLY